MPESCSKVSPCGDKLTRTARAGRSGVWRAHDAAVLMAIAGSTRDACEDALVMVLGEWGGDAALLACLAKWQRQPSEGRQVRWGGAKGAA